MVISNLWHCTICLLDNFIKTWFITSDNQVMYDLIKVSLLVMDLKIMCRGIILPLFWRKEILSYYRTQINKPKYDAWFAWFGISGGIFHSTFLAIKVSRLIFFLPQVLWHTNQKMSPMFATNTLITPMYTFYVICSFRYKYVASCFPLVFSFYI